MIAKSYLDKSSKEYYMASTRQITIKIQDENNFSMLNSDGLKLLNNIKEKIKNNKFTNTIIDYIIMHTPSGMWINDLDSIYCDNSDIKASLHSFDNVKIYGIINKTQNVIMTSNIIMYSSTWCYTSGGHLYKLVNKFDILNYN